MLRYLSSYIVILFILQSCTKDITSGNIQVDINLKRQVSSFSPSGSYKYYILPGKDEYDAIPQDQRNPLSFQKVELGKMLFFETALAQDAFLPSGNGTYSCSSCHIVEAGFRPGAAQGIADGGEGFGLNGESRLKLKEYKEHELDVQGARPLSLVNVAYVTNTFWNGQFGGGGVNVDTEDVWDLREDTERNHLGYEAIETQNFEGIVAHRIQVNKELLDQYGYTKLFDKVFPDVKEDLRYSQFTASLALSAYIRSLITYKAPFQKWLSGDLQAMSSIEKEGLNLFFGKANCANCHFEQNLGSSEFHALGVKDMYQRPSFNTDAEDRRNLGRGGFTLKTEDYYKFKVPGLYNVSDAPFYFHGSSKSTLEDLVNYKITAKTENSNISQDLLSSKFKPLDLDEKEKEALLIFLSTSLRDPDLIRYKPTDILSGNCFPNNDLQSRRDLGCE